MSKHTPGPWTGGKECINAPDGRVIAEVQFYNSPDRRPMGRDEYEANSNLIAAAPELLSALKEVAAMFKYPETREVTGVNHKGEPSTVKIEMIMSTVKRIGAAIAKAEGRDTE